MTVAGLQLSSLWIVGSAIYGFCARIHNFIRSSLLAIRQMEIFEMKEEEVLYHSDDVEFYVEMLEAIHRRTIRRRQKAG